MIQKNNLYILFIVNYMVRNAQSEFRSMHSDLIPQLVDILLPAPLEVTTQSNQIICADSCFGLEDCAMFAFGYDDNLCAFYSAELNSNNGDIISAPGMKYYYVFKGDKKCTTHSGVTQSCSGQYCFRYLYNFEPFSYADAAAMCARYGGGKMVKVDSDGKQLCMEQMLYPIIQFGGVYIQGSYNATSQQWEFDDGTSMSQYTNWDTNEPKTSAGANYIGVVDQFGYFWRVFGDKELYGVVCELE